jgi:AraC-like DNA-binding protein
MADGDTQIKVEAWEENGLLLERYQYSEGWCNPLPFHAHTEYQFAVCVNEPGSYFYRGSSYQIPVEVLAVLHAGEPHQTGDERRRFLPAASHLMMYVEPQDMLAYAHEIIDRPSSVPPYFPQVLLEEDHALLRAYVELFLARGYGGGGARIERDVADLSFFAKLITRHAHNRAASQVFRRNKSAVNRAVEYLRAHFINDISLEELARIAGVSKFYLVRAFRREVGIPPHKYLLALRVSHAKRMLLRGSTVAEVATQIGFYDESHLGKYFRQIVGVTPGAYVGKDKKKNTSINNRRPKGIYEAD